MKNLAFLSVMALLSVSLLGSAFAFAGADLFLATNAGTQVSGFKVMSVGLEIDPGASPAATVQIVARNADGKLINVNLDGFDIAEGAALNTALGGTYATSNGAPSIVIAGSSLSISHVQQVPSLIPGRDFYRGDKGTVLVTLSRTTP